ncbi:MAG: ATP synthase F1 subunit gamma [Thermoanaerobaculia bacterium]
MANRRVLVKRRKSVRNLRKITRTMQLISTARFQASLKRAVEGRPYAAKLAELAADLGRAAASLDHPLMRVPEPPRRSTLLVLTSNRGLCGSYNANVLRAAMLWLDAERQAGRQPEVWMVGRKGASYFRFVGRQVHEQIGGVSEKPAFVEVERIANRLMERFLAGETDRAAVAYMKFHSAGRQAPAVEPLLPLTTDVVAAQGDERPAREIEYEFLPAPKELLDELLPATVRVRLYQCFNDATVSEHVARMVAMKAATDAADDMNKALTREYNRARQTAITMELLDIVGGANALA